MSSGELVILVPSRLVVMEVGGGSEGSHGPPASFPEESDFGGEGMFIPGGMPSGRFGMEGLCAGAVCGRPHKSAAHQPSTAAAKPRFVRLIICVFILIFPFPGQKPFSPLTFNTL